KDRRTGRQIAGLRLIQRPHRSKDPQGLRVEGLAGPLRDAVVVDGGIHRRFYIIIGTGTGVWRILTGRNSAGKAAATLGDTGVGVEVRVAAADGTPVEQALVFHVGALVEHAVQRFRLARPRTENPGDAIGQPVRMTGPAAAPGVFRLLASEIPRDDVADRRAKDAVVGDTKGSEEGHLADQDGVREAARGRGRAPGNGAWEREAQTVLDVHGRGREIGLVVSVATGPILAHGDPARQVARLETAVHSGASRVQDVELAVRWIEFGAEHLVATPADDQER